MGHKPGASSALLHLPSRLFVAISYLVPVFGKYELSFTALRYG